MLLVAMAMTGIFFLGRWRNNCNNRFTFCRGTSVRLGGFVGCRGSRFLGRLFNALATGFFCCTLGFFTHFQFCLASSFFCLATLDSRTTLFFDAIGKGNAVRWSFYSRSRSFRCNFNNRCYRLGFYNWLLLGNRFRCSLNSGNRRLRYRLFSYRLDVSLLRFGNDGFDHFILAFDVSTLFAHFNIDGFLSITRTGFNRGRGFTLQSDFLGFQNGFAMAVFQERQQTLLLIIRYFCFGVFVLQTSFLHLLKQTLYG